MILAEPDGGAHRGMTEVGDAPAPGTRDFADEPADVESFRARTGATRSGAKGPAGGQMRQLLTPADKVAKGEKKEAEKPRVWRQRTGRFGDDAVGPAFLFQTMAGPA